MGVTLFCGCFQPVRTSLWPQPSFNKRKAGLLRTTRRRSRGELAGTRLEPLWWDRASYSR